MTPLTDACSRVLTIVIHFRSWLSEHICSQREPGLPVATSLLTLCCAAKDQQSLIDPIRTASARVDRPLRKMYTSKTIPLFLYPKPATRFSANVQRSNFGRQTHKARRLFSAGPIARMPEQLTHDEINSQTDPSVAKQYDTAAPKEQQLNDLYSMLDGKNGMLSTHRQGIGEPFTPSSCSTATCTNH